MGFPYLSSLIADPGIWVLIISAWDSWFGVSSKPTAVAPAPSPLYSPISGKDANSVLLVPVKISEILSKILSVSSGSFWIWSDCLIN